MCKKMKANWITSREICRPFEASPDPMTRAMKRMTTKKRRMFVEYVTSGKRSKRWQKPSPLAAMTQEEITEHMRALAKEMTAKSCEDNLWAKEAHGPGCGIDYWMQP